MSLVNHLRAAEQAVFRPLRIHRVTELHCSEFLLIATKLHVVKLMMFQSFYVSKLCFIRYFLYLSVAHWHRFIVIICCGARSYIHNKVYQRSKNKQKGVCMYVLQNFTAFSGNWIKKSCSFASFYRSPSENQDNQINFFDNFEFPLDKLTVIILLYLWSSQNWTRSQRIGIL